MVTAISRDGYARTCCCGRISVRTGTIVIAVIWLVVSVLNASVYAGYLVLLTDEDLSENPSGWLAEWDGRNSHREPDPEVTKTVNDFYKNYRPSLLVFVIFMLLCALTNAVLSALLLHGAIKNGPHHRMVPWLYFNSMGAIVSAICSIRMAMYLTSKYGDTEGFKVALLLLIVYSAYVYLFRVVHLYIQEVKRREREKGLSTIFDGVGLIYK